MSDERPSFSRCSVGRNKWFWVTYSSWVERAIDASGYVKSAVEAEEEAMASILATFGCSTPEQLPHCFASGVHRREAIKRRTSRKSEATETNGVEYLFTDGTSEWDGHEYSLKHRIIKKTAKKVYVARYPIRCANEDDWWEEDGQVFHDVKTVVLDRQQLEKEGYATSGGHWEFFYTTPWEERHKPLTSRCLEALGLEGGADREAINGAYRRLAMKHHPDHGGNAEDFKRLQEAYETAMSSVA